MNWQDSSEALNFAEEGLDPSQGSKRPLFELYQAFAIGCAAFRVNENCRTLSSLSQDLPISNLFHYLDSLFFSGLFVPLDHQLVIDLAQKSHKRHRFDFILAEESGVIWHQ